MYIKRYVISLMYVLVSFSVLSQKYEPKARGELVRHTYYSLSYMEEHEQAEWVYYLLKKEYVEGEAERGDNFRADDAVSTGSAELYDYKSSGYDRGHLCPAADMKISEQAMSETFFMSNMSPQVPSFNRGIWSALEDRVRKWVLSLDSIYIVTGPLFEDTQGTIGANDVTIPGYYYKVLYSPSEGGMMIAFLLPNGKCEGKYYDYEVTVDELEKRTGIDFFAQLPDRVEYRLEAEKHYGMWSKIEITDPKPVDEISRGEAVQCKGIAKSTGQRCKSKTRNINGYCDAHQNQAPGYREPKQLSKAVQCKGIAKSTGKRCKSMTRNPNGYCNAHQNQVK